MKVKTPFMMTSTPLMKVTRYLCQQKLRIMHFARTPTDCIDSVEIKAECKLGMVETFFKAWLF